MGNRRKQERGRSAQQRSRLPWSYYSSANDIAKLTTLGIFCCNFANMFLELRIQVLAEADVIEHALQLGGVLVAANVLQLGDHTLLGVIGGRREINEALRQHFGVKLLEHILVIDILQKTAE